MNKNSLYMGLMISAILAVILYTSYGILNGNRELPYYSVSVIVEDSSNDRWNAFKEGLEQGASEHRIYLNIVSVTELSDVEEENAILQREVENGAQGVIIEMYDSEDTEGTLLELLGDTAAVLVGNGMESPQDAAFTVVSTDACEVGAAIANAASADYSGTDASGTIGILAGNQKKRSMQQRLQGFTDAIAESGLRVIWSLSEEEAADEGVFAEQMEQEEPDILIALENDALECAIDYLIENPDIHCGLYGEGRSEKTVYYLDKGLVSGMVVADEYSMGYQSVVQIAAQLEDHDDTVQTVTVEFLTVTPDQMYSEDTERILFPVI
ncbi:MAG: substrate-binding domain-containing protein [Lachnospiraceae bacterium]|nr:substrate-binding domain-containing protein [Lachnospiraceae bacterium]